MPEDSKKDKRKSEPKEQRRPRHARHPPGPVEKKPEKVNSSKSAPKVTVPQKPPVYESPGPEFYKNLKRETDEIIKITEEENSKYKKKEIQSNWTKYEMPIETYEEMEEQESMGADYEKLIQAPLSIGGHFQFKHEKSWDITSGPSAYDKYFDIKMENLALALCTVPFYERNNIDKSIFTETDILTMNNRSTKFKQRYFNDKSYSTPETEMQEKTLRLLREDDDNIEEKLCVENDDAKEIITKTEENKSVLDNKDINLDSTVQPEKEESEIEFLHNISITNKNIENSNKILTNNVIVEGSINKEFVEDDMKSIQKKVTIDNKLIDDNDDDEIIFGKVEKKSPSHHENISIKSDTLSNKEPIQFTHTEPVVEVKVPVKEDPPKEAARAPPHETKKPIIESPEDLEKWLDDFLDG